MSSPSKTDLYINRTALVVWWVAALINLMSGIVKLAVGYWATGVFGLALSAIFAAGARYWLGPKTSRIERQLRDRRITELERELRIT